VQIWRNPVAQFLAAGLVTMVLLVVALGWLGEREATEQARRDAEEITEVLAQSVAEPAIPVGLVEGRAAAADKFDQEMRERLLIGRVLRVKIWNANGWIVYSDKTELMWEQFGLDEDELDVMDNGGTVSSVTDLAAEENRFETGQGKLLEVYTRIWAPTGEPLMFEAYFSYDEVTERSQSLQSAFRPITIFGLLAFLAVTAPLVWVLARRLDAAARERERLLRAAVEASDSERRRIARDLHDTVVQDLAGTSFALSAATRQPGVAPELAEKLSSIGGSIRSSLRSLRSLLVEIYPPDLGTDGLAAAVDDLVASAAAAGVATSVSVADTRGVSEEAVGLVWRVAQESVRNALRHGNPSTLRVSVEVRDSRVILDVVDDGSGFDPSRLATDGHFGLRGLRDLIDETGGRLDIDSAPGQGTRIRLEANAR
jgi:signal transduction histidine kinase